LDICKKYSYPYIVKNVLAFGSKKSEEKYVFNSFEKLGFVCGIFGKPSTSKNDLMKVIP
jgi:hypothetical protein